VSNEQEQWQLDGTAPELYQCYLVPAVTAGWAADLVRRVELRPGERVLDVACGTGVIAREAARGVGSAGRVAAVDVNEGMLDVARSLPEPPGAAVEWRLGSALDLPFDAAAFDVVVCQLGLQFFPDRPVALREMRRVLADGGRLGLNVYGPIDHNPATRALSDALDRHVGPGASLAKRAEHALGDTAELRALVDAAGFREIAVDTVTRTVSFPSAADYVRIQLTATPLASLDAPYDAVSADVGAALAPYGVDGALRFPQEAHVLLARA
jgi:ubiquinone/menaquinone biosynthesis C-methylase UbiE